MYVTEQLAEFGTTEIREILFCEYSQRENSCAGRPISEAKIKRNIDT